MLWNPVVLRTNLSGNPSFLQVLFRVHETVLGAFANQEYPFDFVLQDYRKKQNIHTPLYSIIFIFQNASEARLQFDGITMQASLSERLAEQSSAHSTETGRDRPDLHIEVYEVDGQLTLITQYNASRFSAATVDSWLAQFISLLDQISTSPEKRLSQLTLSDYDELDELFGG
jgi:non-ribosomal peptide synthetase component F